ncbi:tRNA1(Val) (adenine(37)-N6)-methyltransferase [Agarivorans sp. DSG3-1]|uniref:tRNA1(Val) (adenine(37)-N6)-methyltransferase n=1 Tax=Agarivorans sp. DSG3-1 TaxID=3342249 RepID=UPI00398EBA42
MIEHNQRPGFTFKQFHVAHDQTAMKVGTDGILLAAWSPLHNIKRVLDVGTGTGLISLILAQRLAGEVLIDAIDIETDACSQAQQNVAHSPWPLAINVQLQSMQNHQSAQSYDLVISNPPYFSAGQVFEEKRQQARHSGSLNAQAFFAALAKLAHQHTQLAVILPCDVAEQWLRLAELDDWHLARRAQVHSFANKPAIRSMLLLTKSPVSCCQQEQILIYQQDKSYSTQFVNLCRDLYLKM